MVESSVPNQMLTSVRKYVKSHSALRGALTPALRAMRKIRPSRQQELWRAYGEIFEAVEEGSLVVRVPEFGGSFEIDCHSHILKRILTSGQYEPELIDIIRRRIDADRDVIDAGANIGLFTVLMSGLISDRSRVLAIEPTPGALKNLRRNLERNHRSSKVIVFPGVAADNAGEFTLNVIAGMEEYSSLGKLVHPAIQGETSGEIRVPGETIDRLVEKYGLRPGFLKIDTEGTEYQVLAGARNTVRAHRPVILCESWPDRWPSAGTGTRGSIIRLLEAYGYVIAEWPESDEFLAVPKELLK